MTNPASGNLIAKMSRREFAGATAAAAFTIVSPHVLGGPGKVPPSEKLNIAGIGVGGRGAGDLDAVKCFPGRRNGPDEPGFGLCCRRRQAVGPLEGRKRRREKGRRQSLHGLPPACKALSGRTLRSLGEGGRSATAPSPSPPSPGIATTASSS